VALPELGIGARERRGLRDARVVDEDVDRAERGGDRAGGEGGGLGVTDVERERHGLGAARAQGAGRLLDGLGRARRHGDGQALAGEGLGDRATDPTAPARHEGHASHGLSRQKM
jgi:hypothetical protein